MKQKAENIHSCFLSSQNEQFLCQELCSLISHNPVGRWNHPHFTDEELKVQVLYNMPKVTQLMNSKAGMWTQDGKLRTWAFFFLILYWICYNIASIFFMHCFFFDHEACGILAPWPGIEPSTPALEGEALTTGPPPKSRTWAFNQTPHCFFMEENSWRSFQK